MSQVTLTKADVLHIKEALEDYKYWIQQYPETVNQLEEENLAIALEIIQGVKLHAYTDV
jgi:hypothetical protein